MSLRVCKFYVKGDCKDGNNCKFLHEKNICKSYFFDNKCQRENCKFTHIHTLNKNKNENKKRKPRNTENFNPDHRPSDMNILVNKSQLCYRDNDVVIVPNFIQENEKYDIYHKLLSEMDDTCIDKNKLWKEWHGDTHLIADDKLNWKNNVSTFNKIIKRIEDYFHIDVKSTRFNLYEDSNDWKPYHHDAAAVKEHIAEQQNFTVGLSFGAKRDIAFEHAQNKTRIYIPLENCTAYAFSKNINIDWKHGVPQIPPDKAFSEGRISIIVWGKVNITS